MGLKKSRTIVVRDRCFRWKFKGHRDNMTRYGNSPRFAHVAIQEDVDKPGRSLVAFLESTQFIDDATHDGDTGHIRHLARFGPGDVKRLIEYALDNGWDPSSKTQTILPEEIKLTDHRTINPDPGILS